MIICADVCHLGYLQGLGSGSNNNQVRNLHNKQRQEAD